MNKYRKLIKNSGIFTVANFGTKLLNIVFVPLYTYWLTTSEFGTVDLVTTTINLLSPIVMLGMSDAVMRFAFEKNIEKRNLISSGMYVVIIGSITVGIIGLVLSFASKESTWSFKKYISIFLAILCSQGINSVLAQYHRGIGNVVTFASNGIIITIVQIIMNLITLLMLKMGVMGYLLSMLVSYIIPSVYLLIKDKVWTLIKLEYKNNELIRRLIYYTLPLIPTNMMWWVMNMSSRYVIVGTLGVAANGIFAVSNKIPTIINLLNTIFQQAWQMSAIEEFNDSKNSKQFMSQVYYFFVLFMILGTDGLMIIVYPVVRYTFSTGYFDSIEYIPFLLVAAMFSNFAGFLGTSYVAAKSTLGALKTSFIGATINLILTILLVRPFGLLGVSISMIVSYFVTWIYRSNDTQKIIQLYRLDSKILLSIGVVIITSFVISNTLNILSVLYGLISFIGLIIINQNSLLYLINSIFKGVNNGN